MLRLQSQDNYIIDFEDRTLSKSSVLRNFREDIGETQDAILVDYTRQQLVDLRDYLSGRSLNAILVDIYQNEGIDSAIDFYDVANFFDIPELRHYISRFLYDVVSYREQGNLDLYYVEEASKDLIEPYLREDFLDEHDMLNLRPRQERVCLKGSNKDLTLSEELAQYVSSPQELVILFSKLNLPIDVDISRNICFTYSNNKNELRILKTQIAIFEKFTYDRMRDSSLENLLDTKFILMKGIPPLSRADIVYYDQQKHMIGQTILYPGKPGEFIRRHEIYWYSNGNKRAEGDSHSIYSKWIKDGIWTYYHQDGSEREKGLYMGGKKNGEWNELYPNGKIHVQKTFINDYLDGEYIDYYEDGNIEGEVLYKMGKRDGLFRRWDREGNVITEGFYVNDRQDGRWHEIEPNGNRIQTDYDNGRMINRKVFPKKPWLFW